MDEDVASYLPVFGGETLDKVPIISQIHQIRQLVVEQIDASIKYDQLKAPQIHNLLIKPIIEKIIDLGLNGGTLYCLLANIDQFQKQAQDEPSNAGLCKTRASSCEIICSKLLKEYSRMQLAEALIFDFYPLSDGNDNVQIPAWLRISAIELAIHTQSKHFLSNPAVSDLVQDLWNGKLVFDTYLNKSHRFNFNSREELGMLVQSRKGLVRKYEYQSAGMFKLSRLRVPRYRSLLRTLSMVGFLFFYFQHSVHRQNTFYKRLFLLYGVGLCLDEFVYLWTVRPSIYLMSLWSICDMTTLTLFALYASLYTWYPGLARDILATMSITLVPRIFGVFDANESFSKMLMSVRQMSIDLGISWLVVTIFSVGFWAAFAFSFSRDFSSPEVVAYDFVRIMFGYTGAGWDQWEFYHFFGKASLLAYLFLTQFVVRPILTAVLSDTYSHVNENSTLEYNYLRALNTISKLKTEATVLFFYVPPLNILEWMLFPTQYIMSYNRFLILNRTLLKITHLPILLAIFLYESVSWRVTSLKQVSQQHTRQNLVNKVASLESLNPGPVRGGAGPGPSLGAAQPLMMRNSRANIRSLGTHTRARAFSNYALLDELFNNPVLSVKYGQSIPGVVFNEADESISSVSTSSGIDTSTNTLLHRSPESVEARLTRLEQSNRRIETLLVAIQQDLERFRSN